MHRRFVRLLKSHENACTVEIELFPIPSCTALATTQLVHNGGNIQKPLYLLNRVETCDLDDCTL